MSRICQVSNKQANNGYSISHSHIRNKKKQHVNLQNKRMWSIKENRWIKVKVATKVIKSLYKFKI